MLSALAVCAGAAICRGPRNILARVYQSVPIGITVAKTMKFGKRIIKFQLGAEHSVISQDDYGKRTTLKLNIIPVIASPQKKPIF